jgi:hypothetical protein
MREPSARLMCDLAGIMFGYETAEVAKVLVIVDGPEGIVAHCTEADPLEIRGLMYRAGIALPERMGP